MISSRGKRQDIALKGTIRIEQDNDRIVYTNDSGVIIRIDRGTETTFFDGTNGGRIMQYGLLDDGRWGISWFDPVTGIETARGGILPSDVAGVAIANEGVDLPDAY